MNVAHWRVLEVLNVSSDLTPGVRISRSTSENAHTVNSKACAQLVEWCLVEVAHAANARWAVLTEAGRTRLAERPSLTIYEQAPSEKTCSGCGETKDVTEFDRRSGSHSKDGLFTKCRPCRREYEKGWYSKNKIIVRRRKKEQMRARRADPVSGPIIREQKRSYWAAGAGEKDRESKNKTRANHFFVWRAQLWRWRNKVDITAVQLAHLWLRQRCRCALSGRALGRDAHLDHIIPSADGGPDTIDNLRWCDPLVNVTRGSVSDAEFIAMCRDVAGWNPQDEEQVA